MRDLGRIEHFVAGAVGPPGARTFYLEIDPGTGPEWYVAEKEQVAMLAAAALEMLEERGLPAAPPGPDLTPPGEPSYRLGRIGIGLEGDLASLELHPTDPGDGEPVTFLVTGRLLEAMARRAVVVVAAGRPPCRVCGLPKDEAGHACPASNGDLRRRR